MNIQRWKGTVWLASLAVGGYLVFYVADFLRRKDDLSKEVSAEDLAKVLDSVKKPAEQKADVVDYNAVQKVFHEQDWTGKEKVVAVARDESKPQVAPKVPVASLLKVLAIKVDTSKPDQSRAYVKFTDPKLDVHKERDDTVLKPGERLFAPYQDIRVEAITGQGVVFAFDDATRGQETVTTSAYVSQRGAPVGIVQVGPEGVIYPNVERRIGVADKFEPFRPEQLMQIRKNEFQVGTETLKELDRDYADILSRDVGYSTHRDARTGANDGIKITRVKEGSIPAQAGLTEGEVLKSINGHKVTSVNDAVAFVKANSETTDTWLAVFEKQGREFTRTYHSPER